MTNTVREIIEGIVVGILFVVLVDQLLQLLAGRPIPPDPMTINIEPDRWRVLAEAREITRQAAEAAQPDAAE